MKKGFSLIEMVVAVSLFAITAMVVVGIFMSASSIKRYNTLTIENQQKLRTASETIVRVGKEATSYLVEGRDSSQPVNIETNPPTKLEIVLGNNSPAETYIYNIKAVSGRNTLVFQRCPYDVTNKTTTYASCTTESDLLGGSINLSDTDSYFDLVKSSPPFIEVSLTGSVVDIKPTTYFNDQVSINNSFYMERIK